MSKLRISAISVILFFVGLTSSPAAAQAPADAYRINPGDEVEVLVWGYVASEGGAPLVLAKGLDVMALKIREISSSHDIPIIEDKALARSLFASCEVGEMIPPDYYKAIAEVIHFIESKRQRVKNISAQNSSL